VAKFIEKRDGHPSDFNHIILTNGASEAAKIILNVILAKNNHGMMLPIP
jgi:alanine transaminase